MVKNLGLVGMVQLKGNVTFAHDFFSSKQFSLIES